MSSILEILKKESGTPVRLKSSQSSGAASSNAMGYYRFSGPDLKKAIEVAVQEATEEASPTEAKVGVRPRSPTKEQLPQDMRPLVDELKSVLAQGFDQLRTPMELQLQLVEYLKKVSNAPPPNVEVNVPEQPINPPVKRVRAVNITRDLEGNISGAEFEIER